MRASHHTLSLWSGGQRLRAQLVTCRGARAGVLFVHGWDSDQHHYEDLSERVAALGATCLTLDLRGHGSDAARHTTVSREDNLADVLAAYDALAGWPGVDPSSVALIGTSYGGYLAAVATQLRPARHLALRVPALYPDAQWDAPKSSLDRGALQSYRSVVQPPGGNRALEACSAFEGNVLVVASGEDEVLPRASIESFTGAFVKAKHLEECHIGGADHALSSDRSQGRYAVLLLRWIQARVLGELPARRG